MKKTIYSIQGVFFQPRTYFGIGYKPGIGEAVTMTDIDTATVFIGIIDYQPGNSITGRMDDVFGQSKISNVVIDDSELSFTKQYFKRKDTIHYAFRKDANDNWTGRYQGADVGVGLARCIITPIEESLFTPPESLNGQPFIGEIVDWAKMYQRHLSGRNPEISCSPQSGTSERKCSHCFFRNYRDAKDKDCHCGENSDIAKKAFGIPVTDFMPEIIDGKEVGYYCPHWTDPNAE